LRDWLSQILNFSPLLQLKLEKCSSDRQPVGKLSIANLWHLLHVASLHVPKVYFVVDALDEMDQDRMESFLQSLNELGLWRPSEIKIIITSRPVATVERILRNVKVLDVRLDKQLVEHDIGTYIHDRLALSSISPSCQTFVMNTVMKKADGLFLYAKLTMDAVLELGVDFEKVLQDMPADLTLVYTNLLEEHSKRSGVPKDLQRTVLQCVTHATRPLRLLELADLIHVIREDGRDIKATKELFRCICGPLLEILPDEPVHVVHHSLTEYLNGTTKKWGPVGYPVFEFGG